MSNCTGCTPLTSRRSFLERAGGGIGILALASLFKQDGLLADEHAANPLAPRPTHFPAKAKSVIYLFMSGKPSMGAWAAYGLGTENQNMPAFVVMPDPAGWPKGGAPAWGNGFLPAAYQGTLLRGGDSPILNLKTPTGVSEQQQQATLGLIN